MKILVLTTLLMTVAAESPGNTQPIIIEDTAPTAVVSFADLNLQSTAGRQALDRRVRHAADDLCFEAGHFDLDRLSETRECYRAALSSAQLQIRAFDRASTAAGAMIAVSGR